MGIHQFRNTRRKMRVADFCQMEGINNPKYMETDSVGGILYCYLNNLCIHGADTKGMYLLKIDRSSREGGTAGEFTSENLGELEEILFKWCQEENRL